MQLWMSSEMQANIADAYRASRKEIEKEVNLFIKDKDYGVGIEKWSYIAIIMEEESDDYGEIIKYHKNRKDFEFRLKIPHNEFLLADSSKQKKLIYESLMKSVILMEKKTPATFKYNEFKEDLINFIKGRI